MVERMFERTGADGVVYLKPWPWWLTAFVVLMFVVFWPLVILAAIVVPPLGVPMALFCGFMNYVLVGNWLVHRRRGVKIERRKRPLQPPPSRPSSS